MPPLNSLQFFDAAARHLSFTRAAEELHVSQAAVSHQIKLLEARLGKPLFRRRGHHLTLTAKGAEYAHAVRQGLQMIIKATNVLKGSSGGVRRLNISALPSFAAKFLVPRLPIFLEQHPGIDVRIHTTEALADLSDGSCDIAIRSGQGVWPGVHADLLTTEELFPVCAPTLMKGRKRLKKPIDLQNCRLIIDEPRGRWGEWLKQAGAPQVPTDKMLVFNDITHALQASIEGQGVCLARGFLAQDDLRAGRLIRPFDLSIPNDYSLWLVCDQTRSREPLISAFREWIMEQVHQQNALT